MQSMASFVSQNVGAGSEKRAKNAMFTGIGVGVLIGVVVFALVLFKGDFFDRNILQQTPMLYKKDMIILKVLHWRQLLPLYYLV